MRRSARVCLLGFGLSLVLSSLACKQELDDEPAADPLEDPWVNAIEDEPIGAAPAIAAAPMPAPASASVGEVAPTSAVLAQPADAAAAPVEAAPAGQAAPGIAKSSSSASASVGKPDPAASAAAVPAAEPAVAGEPTAIEPAPAPTPSAEPAAATKPEPVAPALTIADFNGNFRYSGGSAQRADLDQAIEDAVMQLAMPIRGIGRKRLTNTNPIDDTLEIKVGGDKVQTIFESGFDAECTIDGGTVKWTSKKGDKYKVRVRKKDTKLVQVIEGEDGVKTTVFVLSADKQSLTVHHKIEADRLETPMTYKLSYKRK